MTTYHRLLLLTTLGSGLLTFSLLQLGEMNAFAKEQNPPQQLQSAPLPQATEYYALSQPKMMTLAWQLCYENACQPQFAAHIKVTPRQQSEIGI